MKTIIHINGTTQQYIADNHNDGIIPQLESEDTYYLVLEDAPNVIVGVDELYDVYTPVEGDTHINIIKK